MGDPSDPSADRPAAEPQRSPVLLAPSGRRALAASMLTTVTVPPPLTASVVIDVLDAVSWAILGSAGATPIEARAVLGSLWGVNG
jgi:hypothetical protein